MLTAYDAEDFALDLFKESYRDFGFEVIIYARSPSFYGTRQICKAPLKSKNIYDIIKLSQICRT